MFHFFSPAPPRTESRAGGRLLSASCNGSPTTTHAMTNGEQRGVNICTHAHTHALSPNKTNLHSSSLRHYGADG